MIDITECKELPVTQFIHGPQLTVLTSLLLGVFLVFPEHPEFQEERNNEGKKNHLDEYLRQSRDKDT